MTIEIRRACSRDDDALATLVEHGELDASPPDAGQERTPVTERQKLQLRPSDSRSGSPLETLMRSYSARTAKCVTLTCTPTP